MDLNCGIIIIGSLIWDDDPIRHQWRLDTFGKSAKKIFTSLPIRYGRESSTRENTYTMIMSNHPSTEMGQGIIIKVKNSIKDFSDLENEAYALAKAEKIWKEGKSQLINAKWGTIGLILNPEFSKQRVRLSNSIKKKWAELYQLYPSFQPKGYILESDEEPIINENGLLQIEWKKEMNKFDLLLTTVTKPDPAKPLSAKDIADKMIKNRYSVYFDQNQLNQILTFQDKEIQKRIKKQSK